MFSNVVVTALVAAVGVIAQDGCTASSGFTINSQADLTKLSSCSTLTGNVAVGKIADSELDFGSSLQSISGNLVVDGAPVLQQIKGASLANITGTFQLSNLTQLTSINMPKLTTVGAIEFKSLAALSEFGFTAGIKTCKSVIVADTNLVSLKGLEMTTVALADVNNNKLLVEWESKLTTLSDRMLVTVNGLNFKLSLPNLIWAANLTIANVSSFSAPSLAAINGSIRFDSNFFETVSAPNLTSVISGDVAFVGNSKLLNISMPSLTTVGGGVTIANNTALQKLNAVPKLKSVGGAVKLGGNFTEASLPGLTSVRGTFDLKSTTEITSSCDILKKLAPQSQGGGGQIEGRFNCSGFVANANTDTSSAGGGAGGGTGGAAPKNAAGAVAANAFYVVGAGVMALVASAFL